MRIEQFLKRLHKALAPLPAAERARTVQYYREMLEDRLEEGGTEEEAVAGMEPIETIAADILADAAARGVLKPKSSALNTTLIVLGSPLWLVFAAVAVVIVLALYVVAWSVIVALAAAVAALLLALPVGIWALAANLGAFPDTALFQLGCGLLLSGVGVLLLLPVGQLICGLARGTARAASALWRRATRQGGETA